MIKEYYRLTKPGIIYGNALTAAGGFLLASKGLIDGGLFFVMLVGISLVMASGCVTNNYLDRDIDRQMARTKNRALVQGRISGTAALIYAAVLGVIGVALLAVFTNPLTAAIAAGGWLAYVVLYGIGKRKSIHGTVVGSISGAVPPVVGYCAASGHLDVAAGLLFLILVLWQMPHFYAIAIFRMPEYAAARIPVLPIVSGVRATKIQIAIYILAFTIACVLLTLVGVTGYTYLVAMELLCLGWLRIALQGFQTGDDAVWARRAFRYSLIVLTSFSLLISLDAWLP